MKLSVKKYFSGLTGDSFLLACSSLFAGISTEMLYPILPVCLIQNLKASGSIVGLIEGIAVATQNIIQGVSGYLSDKWQRPKPLSFVRKDSFGGEDRVSRQMPLPNDIGSRIHQITAKT